MKNSRKILIVGIIVMLVAGFICFTRCTIPEKYLDDEALNKAWKMYKKHPSYETLNEYTKLLTEYNEKKSLEIEKDSD